MLCCSIPKLLAELVRAAVVGGFLSQKATARLDCDGTHQACAVAAEKDKRHYVRSFRSVPSEERGCTTCIVMEFIERGDAIPGSERLRRAFHVQSLEVHPAVAHAREEQLAPRILLATAPGLLQRTHSPGQKRAGVSLRDLKQFSEQLDHSPPQVRALKLQDALVRMQGGLSSIRRSRVQMAARRAGAADASAAAAPGSHRHAGRDGRWRSEDFKQEGDHVFGAQRLRASQRVTLNLGQHIDCCKLHMYLAGQERAFHRL
jgi:hypothetical protein